MEPTTLDVDVATFTYLDCLVKYTRRDSIEEIVEFLMSPCFVTGEPMFALNLNGEFSFKNSTSSIYGKNLNKLFKLLNIRDEQDLIYMIQLYFQLLPYMEPNPSLFTPIKKVTKCENRYEYDIYTPPKRQKIKRPIFVRPLNINPECKIQRQAMGRTPKILGSNVDHGVIKIVYKYNGLYYGDVTVIGIVRKNSDYIGYEDVRLCHDKIEYFKASPLISKYFEGFSLGVHFIDDGLKQIKHVIQGEKDYYIVR